MEYKIIIEKAAFTERKQLEKLNSMVNEAISLGWRPVGGITMLKSHTLLQAMVKD